MNLEITQASRTINLTMSTPIPGRSAYKIAVDNGFIGTEQEWLATIGGIELGESQTTAYRGDRGKAAYDHSQEGGNPHNTLLSQLENDVYFVSDPTYVHTDNDYTTTEKNKLSGVEGNANNYTHPAEHDATMITGLAAVATTGSYTDLNNKPTIPATTSQLTNDSSFETTVGSQTKVNVAITTIKDGVTTDGDTLAKLRGLITGLQVLLDSDDTTLDTLQEVIVYIKSNKTILDSVTTSKVNITDVINDVTHTDTNKPLAANQGKILKDLLDTLTIVVGGKQASLGFTPVANTITVNGQALSANVVVTATNVGLGNVTNTSDANKPVSTAQQTALNAKEPLITVKNTAFNKNYGTTATDVKVNGTQGVGSVDAAARIDHVHPTDTTRASSTHASAHVTGGSDVIANAVAAGNSGLMTGADKTKLDGIASGANNYAHPTGDGNLHVPATSTTNNGKVLTAGATAGSVAWVTPTGGTPDKKIFMAEWDPTVTYGQWDLARDAYGGVWCSQLGDNLNNEPDTDAPTAWWSMPNLFSNDVGSTGQVLAKTGPIWYDIHWVDLPSSGTGDSITDQNLTTGVGQVKVGTYTESENTALVTKPVDTLRFVKKTINAQVIPPDGLTGQILRKKSDAPYDTEFGDDISSDITAVDHASNIFTLDIANKYIANFKITSSDANAKSISLSNVPATANKVVVISVLAVMTTVCALTHPAGVIFVETLPTMTAGQQYLFTYESVDGGTSYAGYWIRRV